MDKVYVLTMEDVSDGTKIVDNLDVYSDYNKAKQRFDLEVKKYLDNNDFFNYHMERTEDNFVVYLKDNYLHDHIEIHIKECNIII